MKRACLSAALLISLLMVMAAPARCESATLTLSAPMSAFIEIDGVKHYGRSFSVPVGSRVRILSDVIYESMEVRYRFAFWTHGTEVISNDTSISIIEGGQYTAVYVREYLVKVLSDPLLFAESFWVEESSKFNAAAPMEIKVDGDVLYRFTMWGGDLTAAANTIEVTVTRPLTLRAVYAPHYPLYIGDKLIGYFEVGRTYYYHGDVEEGENVRRVLENIIVIGGAVIKISQGVFAITVHGRTDAIPVYTTFYKVVVETPPGVSDTWVEEGSSYTLTAPQTITAGDTMYSFVKWEGDVSATTPTYTIQVDRPIHAKAVYTKMYKVTVISPTGEKVRWVEEGKTLYIYEAPEFSRIVTSRVLKGFLVNGAMREPIAPGVLKLDNVTGPATIIAVYGEQVIWTNIAIIAALLAVITAAYVLASKHYKKKT
ncbi:MAG: hypothetical protein QW341_00535 [Candidatus Bathyarchaeia archaeon]